MALITELPPEIIHNVLRFVDPPDLAWVSRICKIFHYSIKGNPTLFRDVYRAHFDTPSCCDDVNWEQALKDVVRLQVVCRRTGVENKVRYSFLSWPTPRQEGEGRGFASENQEIDRLFLFCRV